MTTTPPVTFDFNTWVTMFPEFAALNATLGNAYFIRATGGLIANAVSNPAFNDGNLSYLIYLATSHVAWLSCPKDGNGNPAANGVTPAPANIVGHISSAAEGSVNVQVDWPLDASSDSMEKFLSQTRYGAELWAALAPYRTSQYAARPTIVFGGRFRGAFIGARPWGRW